MISSFLAYLLDGLSSDCLYDCTLAVPKRESGKFLVFWMRTLLDEHTKLEKKDQGVGTCLRP
jgi:hypothetical protein